MLLLKKIVLSLYKMMKPMEKVKTVSEIRRMFYWAMMKELSGSSPAVMQLPLRTL